MDVTPYRVQVADETLRDLRERLKHTRWPDEIQGAGWEYGVKLAYMKDLIDYWRTDFDWRAQEQKINHFANYRTQLDGLGLHFIHEHGRGPRPLPLLITHGWPSSFYETLDIIPLLTDPGRYGGDPADAFDVVIPSLPGYGFSDRPTHPGMTSRQISALLVRLMEGLGYERFAAQIFAVGSTLGAADTSSSWKSLNWLPRLFAHFLDLSGKGSINCCHALVAPRVCSGISGKSCSSLQLHV